MDVDRDQVQLARTLGALRSSLWLIGLGTLAAAAAVYWLSGQRQPVYEATATVYAARYVNDDAGDTGTVPRVEPPTRGALSSSLLGPELLADIERRLAEGDLAAGVREGIVRDLRADVRDRRARTIAVAEDLDQFNYSGTYQLTARAADPRGAAVLANTAAASLLAWESSRNLEPLRRARQNVQVQLADLTRQLQQTPSNTQAYRDLLTVRTSQLERLSRLSVAQDSVVNSLSLVASAPAPTRPVEPRPVRDAALAAILAASLLAAVFYLRASLDTTVVVEDDLRDLDLRALASVPQVRGARGEAVVRALRQGWSREQVNELRGNLSALLPRGEGRVVVLTSSLPGEGKTSLTAALAEAYAEAEHNVLILDADRRQPGQEAVWRGAGTKRARFSKGAPDRPAATTFGAALKNPESLEVLQVRERVFLLPAGSPNGAGEVLSAEAFGRALENWRGTFDVVLVDGPPLGLAGDALTLAGEADGVLLVAEAGRATRRSLRRAAERLAMRGARLLGVAINKQHRRHSEAGVRGGYLPRVNA